MTDFDSPWKEALDLYLEPFLAFFFPAVHAAIDWSRGYQSREQELRQIVREAELGRQTVDKLFQVWRRDGSEEWLLIHIEVQSQYESDFPRRLFTYNYRLFDRSNRPAVSLAVLADDRPGWRPNEFSYDVLGCRLTFAFPVVKLLDWQGRTEELERDPNPLAALVLAHLWTQQSRQDAPGRLQSKLRLIRGLYERGLDRAAIQQLFRLIDWMMDLPAELSQQFWTELQQMEEEKKMPYITSVERMALDRGRAEGRAEGAEAMHEAIGVILELKFGAAGLALLPDVRRCADLERLQGILHALKTAAQPDDVRALLG